MRRALAVGAAIAVVTAIGPPAAVAAPANILAGDPAAPNPDVFNPTSYNHEAGTVATLTWVAGGAHDADATGVGPDGQPLFRTELTRSATPVPGTQYLPIGVYPFVCTVHSGMAANLNVNSGVPLARPQVSLKLQSTKLEKVLQTSTLRVKARFLVPGSGAEARVEVKLGKKVLATGATTQTKNLSLKISKQEKRDLAKKGTVKLKLSAEVDFGAPAKTSGRLR